MLGATTKRGLLGKRNYQLMDDRFMFPFLLGADGGDRLMFPFSSVICADGKKPEKI